MLIINDKQEGTERWRLGYACFDDPGRQTKQLLALTFDARLVVDPLVKATAERLLKGLGEELDKPPVLEFAVTPWGDDANGLTLLAGVVKDDTAQFSMILKPQGGKQAVALENLASPRGLPINVGVRYGHTTASLPMALSLARREYAFIEGNQHFVARNVSPFPATVRYYMQSGQLHVGEPKKFYTVKGDGVFDYRKWQNRDVALPGCGVVYKELKGIDVIIREFVIDPYGFSLDEVFVTNMLSRSDQTRGKLKSVSIQVVYKFTPNDRRIPTTEQVKGAFTLYPAGQEGAQRRIPFLKSVRAGKLAIIITGTAHYERGDRAIRVETDDNAVRLDDENLVKES
jgi:hypothetical protein